MSSESGEGGGLGIVGVVTVVFITLKALAIEPVASWSWGFAIFGPFLISLAFWLVVFGLFFGVLGFGTMSSGVSSWFGRRYLSKLERMADAAEKKEREEGK